MKFAWFFVFFAVSGFCSLVYQVVWIRLSMAAFGVTAPVSAIVLSTFMAGLALGSWGGGWLSRREERSPTPALRLYALAELLIAVSGVTVPAGLALGSSALTRATDMAWGSLAHYLVSGAWVVAVVLPFCTCMGATFPLAIWAIRRLMPERSSRSFSFLYLANVLGAALGTLSAAFILVELLGFRGTALLAAVLNALLAATAWRLSLTLRGATPTSGVATAASHPPDTPLAGRLRPVLRLLFFTGLSSMGMEVVWMRQFTPYLDTMVYAVATILALYLFATLAGSTAYRLWLGRAQREQSKDEWLPRWLWPALPLSALLPLLAADPRLPTYMLSGAARVALGIAPLCATLGFITPWLVDRWAGGNAYRAGSAYALNVLGCVLGPLLAGFGLLPLLGERGTLLALTLPLFAFAREAARLARAPRGDRAVWTVAGAGSLLLVVATHDFATMFPRRVVRRDHVATVIAAGTDEGFRLLVNGVEMTSLTPITKIMAHLPLAFLDSHAHRALVICFGMGTSFRSFLSWGIESTAVELVPSVPQLFGFFHPDGPELLRSPLSHIVIDDGRRFLERTVEQYDAITIDPPPPVEAAGSSLLYSREFYQVASRRLRRGGVLQQWVPTGDGLVFASFTRALTESFSHVRAFRSIGGFGIHYLASDRPLPPLTAAELASRLPPAANADLLQWGPGASAQEQFAIVLDQEVAVDDLLKLAPGAPALTDDRPVNEYFLLRRLTGRFASSAPASE